MDDFVVLRNLNKQFGPKYAVHGINLNISRGKIIGLLGPNGSGKTTLMKMMAGVLTPTSGQIMLEGLPPSWVTKSFVAYLPDKDFLDENQSIEDTFQFFADFYQDFSVERARTLLDQLGVDIRTKIKTLSKGNKEKLQLILIMSRNASLYILDEPIAGVDPAARDYILKTIISNYNPQATVLISTHLISDIEGILDEVIFIHQGGVMLYDAVENIRNKQQASVDAYFREVFACWGR